jgi:hypothetical protein
VSQLRVTRKPDRTKKQSTPMTLESVVPVARNTGILAHVLGEDIAMEEHHRRGGDESKQLDVVVAALREVAEAHGRVEIPRSGSRATRSADGQSIDLERRLSHADRHALAVLAAGADAAVELQVVADHRDARQASGPLPISVAPLTG